MSTPDQKLVGGPTPPQEADAVVQGLADQVKSKVEDSLGRTLATYEAKLYRTQLVNGTNYFIKIDTGNGTYIHVRLHKTFQGEVTFHSCLDKKTKEDELQYF